VRERIITVNPLAGLPAPHKLESRERVLTDDEIKAIWNATDYRPFGHIVRCLILSGQRRMEIAGGKAEWVTDVYTIPQTKNRQPHVIPVTPLLKEYLKPPFVFNGWSKAKVALDKTCGVDDWTLHDCRRYFSTTCAQLQVPIHLTERILNHKTGSVSGVAKIYNRYSYLKEMEEALLLYESHIRKITTA
jgi:integrase